MKRLLIILLSLLVSGNGFFEDGTEDTTIVIRGKVIKLRFGDRHVIEIVWATGAKDWRFRGGIVPSKEYGNEEKEFDEQRAKELVKFNNGNTSFINNSNHKKDSVEKNREWVAGKSLKECMGEKKLIDKNVIKCRDGYFNN